MAAVVWMFTRYDLPKSFRLPVTVLLALCVYKAFLMEWVWHFHILHFVLKKKIDQVVALLDHQVALWESEYCQNWLLTIWLCLSFLYLQVVHPHLPLGQLDSSVGQGSTDKCYRSLLAVSVRHTGPQQLILYTAPWHNPSVAFLIQTGQVLSWIRSHLQITLPPRGRVLRTWTGLMF